jgi:acetyltransferase
VTRVRSLDEMFEALAIFHHRRLPRGNGLAAISVSGGAAGLLADLALDCGVSFTPLTETTSAELKDVVPEFGSVGNPLDVTGQGVFQTDLLERSLDLLATAPGIDAIVYARSFQAWMDADTPVFQTLAGFIERHPEVPLIPMSLAGGHFMPSNAADTPVSAPVDRIDGMPFLQGAEYGLKAVAAFMRYADFLRSRGQPRVERVSSTNAATTARRMLENSTGARLSATEGSAVLRAYGIPIVDEAFATSAAEACAAAQQIGFPVAIKVEAPGLAHKARAGGVVLDVSSVEQTRDAFERVTRAANGARGVLVQAMVKDAVVEVIVGMSRDPQFGPVIACGLGGVLVETLRDVQLLLPPVGAAEARRALDSLRGAALLADADVDSVIDVLTRFSELCIDVGSELQAIDMNPLLVRRQGRGACVVDCLFERLESPSYGTP